VNWGIKTKYTSSRNKKGLASGVNMIDNSDYREKEKMNVDSAKTFELTF
jgi:hypothetical protein